MGAVVLSATTEASIRMQRVGRVHGRVQLPAGIQGASVTLTSASATAEEAVAQEGTFAFESVLPGEYLAKVVCQGCGGLLAKPVKLAPGDTVALQFP